jgi:pimeloyl-ACP methyl ester carboxylesterase
MARQIPEVVLQTFDGVGHNMKVEIPDLLAGQVLQFIGQVYPRTGGG